MTRPFRAIPGPKEVPFVGAFGALSGDPLVNLPQLVADYGDLVRFSFLGTQFLIVADPDAIREVLVEKADLFPKAPRDVAILGKFLGNGLVTNNGASHKKQRKLAQPAFHSRRIQSYATVMTEYAEAFTNEWRTGQVYDMAEAMRALTMYIVAKTLFDVDRSDIAPFAEGVGVSIHNLQEISDQEFSAIVSLPEWLPTSQNRRRKESIATLNQTIRQIIAMRQAQTADGGAQDKGDLLSMLMLARDEEGHPMSDQQLRDEVVTLFVAGHETTSNVLTWTWYLLAQHPEVEAKLHEEHDRVLAGRTPTLTDLPALPYTLQVIKESMRLYPSVWVLNTREAAATTTIGDYEIPKGTQIFVSQYIMHRHPKYYADPDHFQPERWTREFEDSLPKYAYIPFGGGPRICIGNSFAMMETQLLLATIAQRFSFELAPNVAIGTKALITLGPDAPLRMRVVERAGETAEETFAQDRVLA